jgi:hypothetical protein
VFTLLATMEQEGAEDQRRLEAKGAEIAGLIKAPPAPKPRGSATTLSSARVSSGPSDRLDV